MQAKKLEEFKHILGEEFDFKAESVDCMPCCYVVPELQG